MADNELPDFSGKVVVFYMASHPAGTTNGVIMEEAQFRRFGERLFVVGRTPEKTDSMWASHLDSGVAWDSVVHYLLPNSREDYERHGQRDARASEAAREVIGPPNMRLHLRLLGVARARSRVAGPSCSLTLAPRRR